jgi:hypothetical protein
MMKLLRSWIALAALVSLATTPVPAAAQAARTGPTFRIGGSTSPVILPDVAHDSLHDRYLVVQGNGFIEGQLLDANGNKLNAFPVAMGSRVGGYSQTPRVAFSPDLNGGQGGYLVTWHESVGPIAQVRGKLLSHDGGALTGDIVIALEAGAAGTGSNWTMGAAVAYSTASREFLVTWMGGYFTSQDIRFTRVNTAGTVLQTPVAITGGPDWERDPSVAYNPHQNEFYITYAGYLDAGHFGYVNGQRIQAGTGALVGGPATFIQSAATLIPHVDYNPATQQYVIAWWNTTGGGAGFYGVSVNGATGAVIGGVRIVSRRYFAYDALDFSYNAGSGDFLLVTHGAGLQDYEDAAIPINADGSPYDNGFILTNTPDVRPVVAGDGNFNPRIVASAARGRYLAVTSSRFAAVHGQFATSSANGGGPTPPAPGPTAVSQPYMSLDVPSQGQPVSGNFAVSGWALDLGATSGTGVDTVHVWAQSVSTGEWIWLGAANMGVSRPDVAAVFQSSRFATAGFGMSASLAPGTYDVNVFAHSLVSNTFNNVQTKRITVVAPPSRPLMFIDLPVPEFVTTRSTLFSISGWALDLSSSSGPGIEAIHVWAFPTNGGAPIMVGATSIGHARNDVAGLFGAQFLGSGYSLQGALPPGDYNLVVFALSSVAHNFNNAAGVHMRVF